MTNHNATAGASASDILTPPPILTTRRLIIRLLEQADLESCHRLFIDIGWDVKGADAVQSLEFRRSWLDWTIAGDREQPRLRQPPYGDRAIVHRESGAFVGLIGLVPSLAPFARLPSLGGLRGARFSPEAGLFWALSPSAQGAGLATEAAEAFLGHVMSILNLRRVVATTDYDNARSIAVMRRLGMRIEQNPYPDVGPDWFQVVGIFEPDAVEAAKGSARRLANVLIRDERPGDEPVIRSIVTEAFKTAPYSAGAEAAIIDGLRESGALTVSLVAERGSEVVGHIAFSPVSIAGERVGWYGLGPVAVRPDHQGRGVGQRLVRAGLDRLKALGAEGVVLLGAAGFYGRFGFKARPQLRLGDAPPEHFLSLSFGEETPSGAVEFHPAFTQA